MNEEKKISRRNFLKKAAIGTAAVSISCIGLTYAGMQPPNLDLPEVTGEIMNKNKRILVTYTTRAGSTAEVAEFISKKLNGDLTSVDLSPMQDVKDLGVYDAVVVGSPIRMGRWVGEANGFIKTNSLALSKVPTAFFSLCMPQTEDHQESFDGYLAAIKEQHTPSEAAFFLGKMDLSKLSFFDRMISKALKAENEDLRDWVKIEDWANTLPEKLSLN